MIKVGIVGSSGYAGQNLIKLLQKHPNVTIETVVGNSCNGETDPVTGLIYKEFDAEELSQSDVVFLAVPHGVALDMAQSIRTKIIDLSADHRCSHTYGLPEVFSKDIANARLVANPGCYATASNLSVFPIREQIEYVVFDCISGYSGAGKNALQKFDYQENVIAYSLTNHFHIKEIEKITGCKLSFTPHVVNTFSGLMCTAHIFLKEKADIENIKQVYQNFYKGSLTRIVENIPCTKDVVGTPFCHIGGFEVDHNNQLVIVSVIDNLLKGAASQAVENMNLMFGFQKEEGLI